MSGKEKKRRRSASVESVDLVVKDKKKKVKSKRDRDGSLGTDSGNEYRYKKYKDKENKYASNKSSKRVSSVQGDSDTNDEFIKNKERKKSEKEKRSKIDKTERNSDENKEQKGRNRSPESKDDYKRKHGDSNKQYPEVNEDHFKKPSQSRDKKHSKKSEHDEEIAERDDSRHKHVSKDDDDDLDEEEIGSRYYGTDYKSKSKSKHEDSGTYDETELDRSDNGYDDRSTSGSEKPVRYWSSSSRPVRQNSDSYWNKYSDRLKDPPENIVEVGPRYYGSGDKERRDKRKEEGSKERRKKEDKDDLRERRKESKEETSKEKEDQVISENVEKPQPAKKRTVDILTSRTGGAYIPPAKLRMMQESITDKSSAAYQRLAWEALKKSIQGHVNKVNTSNIAVILRAVLKENIVRGRGLLCRALIQAQSASPSFTNVYAAFTAVLNAKFPKLGELLLKRLVVQFRRGFKRNDKTICITSATFIAHLVNQEVAHEIIALEILTLLIETPTDDSVEVAIAFLKECGAKLTEVSSKGVLAIFDMLRNILHEGSLEKRVQYMIEVIFQVRKEDFKAHPSIIQELDLVEEEDKIQHMITLEDNHDSEDILNVFKVDPDYEANEAKYKSLVDVGSDDSGDETGSGSGDSDGESEEEVEGGEGGENKQVIVDQTETNLVALRKTIYLTIQSSLDFEECAHKLLRMELKPGQEIEMAHMFLDCCAEQRTYEKFYGLLSQRFCQINRSYIAPFEETFRDSYETVHRMSNDKLRNVAKLFGHLLYTDAISWEVLAIIRLNEDETTSSSRIFIKILFLELSEYMGLAKLNLRVKDPSLQTALDGLFPRDNPKHTRFAINFFTSIGLGGLTDELREHLKSQPKPSVVPQLVEDLSSSSSDSSSDSSDSSDSSSDSSSSESSSSDSEDSSKKKPKKKKKVLSKKVSPKKVTREKETMKRKASPARKKRDR